MKTRKFIRVTDADLKSFKAMSKFIYDVVSQNCDITEGDANKINKAVPKLLNSVDDVHAKAAKIMNLNVLTSNFDVFEKVPKLWEAYYTSAQAQVAPVIVPTVDDIVEE